MTLAAVALLVCTCLYAGFQWTIRLVVYPQLTAVPGETFVAYELRHQRLVSWAVGPLFVLDGAATLLAFVVRPGPASVAAGLCLLAVLGLTAVGAVPQHRRLSEAFVPAAHRRLLHVDTLRLLAALGAVAAAVVYSY